MTTPLLSDRGPPTASYTEPATADGLSPFLKAFESENGGGEHSTVVIDIYTQCMANEVGSVSRRPDDGTINALRHCGFEETDSPTHWRFRFRESIGEFEAVKNRSRSAFHTGLSLRKTQALSKLLEDFSGTGVPAQPPPKDELAGRVRFFVDKYGTIVGAHSFLAGLQAFLEQQRGGPLVCAWRLADDVLTESGGEVFMTDAVKLLQIATFRYPFGRPVAINVSHSVESPEGWHLWTPSWELSDAHVHGMLKALPSAFQCKAAGVVE